MQLGAATGQANIGNKAFMYLQKKGNLGSGMLSPSSQLPLQDT
jgi:hypothetical protein